MKRKVFLMSIAVVLFATPFVWAADEVLSFSIEEALNDPKIEGALFSDVPLYWGKQAHPSVAKKYGEYKASKRTNALGKSKEAACRWALATSLKVLQMRAVKEGGNAVVNIRSNIYNNEKSSATEFDCLAGRAMVNSSIKGDIVKLK